MPDELERLRERVRRDPASRLFISLADELRKAGMIEEAVRVLQEGLERQPDYMSARVALGKIHLEENNLEGALEEFARVADAIPDNLFAQRKLADIYLLLGDREKAIKPLEMVVRLNPMDEDAKAALEKLKGTASPVSEIPDISPASGIPADLPGEAQETGGYASVTEEENTGSGLCGAAEATAAGEGISAENLTGEQSGDLADEVSNAADSLQAGNQAENESAVPVGTADGPELEPAEEDEDTKDNRQVEDLAGWFEENRAAHEEDNELVIETGADTVIEDDATEHADEESEAAGPGGNMEAGAIDLEAGAGSLEITAGDLEITTDDLGSEACNPEATETISPGTTGAFSPGVNAADGLETGLEGNDAEAGLEKSNLEDEAAEEGRSAGIVEVADSMINSGDYGRGLILLRKHLDLHPDDLHALQRMEELKMLIKLLGLEDDVRVSMLGAFLESAKRKKNDPFGIP